MSEGCHPSPIGFKNAYVLYWIGQDCIGLVSWQIVLLYYAIRERLRVDTFVVVVTLCPAEWCYHRALYSHQEAMVLWENYIAYDGIHHHFFFTDSKYIYDKKNYIFLCVKTESHSVTAWPHRFLWVPFYSSI